MRKDKNFHYHRKLNLLLLMAAICLSLCGFLPGCTAQNAQAAQSVSQPDITLDDIPEYSGDAYVTINDNEPFFDEDDYTTKAFENYSPLDKLGRCGTAFANICQEIMPTQKRGEIGSVKPSGWHTVKYTGLVDGNYLYNRCHLIGYQLSGENANSKNLITGTRYFNTIGMLPYEDLVDDYVEDTDNHVLYRVTPLYDGNDLVASGVLMEAWSVEDDGEGICFNVFCYNVQPGITIDYATGDSKENGETIDSSVYVATCENNGYYDDTSPSKDDAYQKGEQGTESTENTDASDVTYIVNTNTGKFHNPGCSSVAQMSESNKKEVSESRDALISEGYEPCKRCNP